MLEQNSSCKCHGALYARELSHRAANAIQQAIAAVHLSRRGGGALDVAMTRLSAAADLHRALGAVDAGFVDAADAIRDVCVAVAATTGAGDGISIVVDAAPTLVDATKLRPLLMIVSELVGNSVRHAFPDKHGTVHVALRNIGLITRLVVEDDGTYEGWRRPGGEGCGIVDELARSMGGTVGRFRTAERSSRILVKVPTIAAAASVPVGTA